MMGPGQFITTLRKGKPGPAYLLCGPDRFLHEECRAAIVRALPPETRDWCLSEIEFEPGRLGRDLQNAFQMPMLGGHSFFILTDPEDFKHATDEDYEDLQQYLERPSSFATLVFFAVEPDRRRRFVQLLEKKAELVEMQPLDRRQAAAWLKAYLGRAGVEIAQDLAEEIAAKFESASPAARSREMGVNLVWVRTEIQKVLAARPQVKSLQPADLELIVAFREEREIGKLLRAIAQRQFQQALEYLRSLVASKQSEILLLWCIGDLFRQALKSASLADARGAASYGSRGAGRGPQGGPYRGWARNPYATAEIAPLAARNYTHQELLQAVRNVRQADLGIKSSWKDSRILLEFLVWRIIAGKGSASLPLDDVIPAISAEG
jgi:DNA polymerase III delta subunit